MVSNNRSEVSNEHVKISILKEDGCSVKLDVHVNPIATQQAYQEAIRTIAKEVSLPGFRKGKVPPAMVLQNFQPHVEKEWKDILLNRALREFVALTKIVPFNKESVHKAQVKNVSLEEGADLHLDFESAPEIPEVDPKALQMTPIKKREITQGEIDQAIARVRTHYAEWNPVTDRAIQLGDSVVVDACSATNPDHTYYKDTSFTVDDENMSLWFKQAILGHHAGDEIEADAEDQEPPARVKITIKEVKSPVLPELDDEFAKKAGAQSLEDMQQKIRQQLEKNAEEEVKFAMREQVTSLLLEKYPFIIPGSVLRQELKRHITIRAQELKDQGMSFADANKKVEEMKEEIEKECENSLRLLFLENELIHKFKIQVTDEEVVRELFAQMYKYSGNLNQARDLLNSPEMHSRIRHLLMTQKIKDFLVEQAEKVETSS